MIRSERVEPGLLSLITGAGAAIRALIGGDSGSSLRGARQ
jgi:hypothetical protein